MNSDRIDIKNAPVPDGAAATLWKLLDDIDTASDVYKPHDEESYKSFYEFTMRMVAKRGEVLESDGHTLSPPLQDQNANLINAMTRIRDVMAALDGVVRQPLLNDLGFALRDIQEAAPMVVVDTPDLADERLAALQRFFEDPAHRSGRLMVVAGHDNSGSMDAALLEATESAVDALRDGQDQVEAELELRIGVLEEQLAEIAAACDRCQVPGDDVVQRVRRMSAALVPKVALSKKGVEQ